MVAGLGNTSFVGLPMIEAYFGKEHLVSASSPISLDRSWCSPPWVSWYQRSTHPEKYLPGRWLEKCSCPAISGAYTGIPPPAAPLSGLVGHHPGETRCNPDPPGAGLGRLPAPLWRHPRGSKTPGRRPGLQAAAGPGTDLAAVCHYSGASGTVTQVTIFEAAMDQ